MTVSPMATGQPKVAAKLLEHEAVSVLMDILRLVAPSELVATASFARRPHGWALTAIKDLAEGAQFGGVDLTPELLACGFIDAIVSALIAVEKLGVENVHGNVVVWGLLGALRALDGEATPQIEELARKALPSALRCVKDSEIAYFTEFGLTAATFAAIVAAYLWGKDEDNPFGFKQGDIDGFIVLSIELMRCANYGASVPLYSNQCRGLLSLCISDAAKQLLLSSNAGFIPHLIDGLLLDPEHPRKGFAEPVKAAVQRDFAECILQISLFPPGLKALKADTAVVTALHALVDTAWSEAAKDCARGALMQLTNRQPDWHPPEVDAQQHIMVS